ncbi:hypothetical protein QBC46DRAFT_357106 [Diplogelasinospora grovesii]|uniref:Actin-like ATPase domain-containing protein n=1 Tax=Diplogelasinospora grovesii TaxID=303347 RepID=A0AAN6N304_9PEZI|nr:hypothetical protein QBC46DRAFT_357106 [Diplogelasinospora grovesii]
MCEPTLFYGANKPEYDSDIMVIGIDFGTTYSGVAWATAADFDNRHINLITTWEGTGREEGKAPTELYENGRGWTWGYDIPLDADPVRWFKLLLLKNKDIPFEMPNAKFLRRAQKVMGETGKKAVDLVADYLWCLWAHVLECLYRSRGKSVVDALPFHVVITVPAIWKGYARQKMRAAAKNAGILNPRPAGPTKLTLVPEPEAASLSTLYEQGSGIKKNDVYVICDAGGGTVDIITYKITETNPIAMEEAVSGAGLLCGGIFIDHEFERMCKNRLGDRWGNLSKAGRKEIMREWESAIKPQFKPTNTGREYIISLPAEAFMSGRSSSLDDTSREPHIKKGRIHFKGSHIQQVFSGEFGRIGDLIDQQIQSSQKQGLTVTGVILVGGLGGSPYLYEHLKGRLKRFGGITILQSSGMKPRTAICRGAVFKGFLSGSGSGSNSEDQTQSMNLLRNDIPIMVTSTISRANYGVGRMSRFEEGVHLDEDKIWHPVMGEWRADNQMQWYLKKGDNVLKAKPVRRTFGNYFDPEHSDIRTSIKKFTVPLHECDDADAPTRRTSSVKPLCNVVVEVACSEYEDFENGQGKLVKKLEYDVEMIPSGSSLEFVVYLKGRRLAEKSVDISFE